MQSSLLGAGTRGEVHALEIERAVLVHDLSRLLVNHTERGAQNFMPLDQRP